MHDPSENGDVVRCDNVTGHDHGEAYTFGVLVDSVECDDHAATVGLTDADFQDKGRDSEEEEGDEVRNEPLEAIVGEDDGWVTEKVAESNSTALVCRVSRRRRCFCDCIIGAWEK